MDKDYILSTAKEIFNQLKHTTPTNVLMSWGICSPFRATTINGMAALSFKVDARLHTGFVGIAYNEGDDLYDLYLQRPGVQPKLVTDGIYWDNLWQIIDETIESGSDPEAYQAFCEQERNKLMQELFG